MSIPPITTKLRALLMSFVQRRRHELVADARDPERREVLERALHAYRFYRCDFGKGAQVALDRAFSRVVEVLNETEGQVSA